MSRTIVHLDADAFFASVEQAADPRLRGKPVAVGGEKRGVVASASYEARKFGVRTPMPSALARKLCPKLILLPGDFEKYEQFSRWMFSYAYDFTPDVEISSIDEGYFDLSHVRKPPLAVATTIRQAIRDALKISVSEGIGANKLVSQIASKLQKPAAFTQIEAGGEIPFLHPLPNRWLPGIGPKTAARLNAAGLALIGQVSATPLELLHLLLGNAAPALKAFSDGIDERPIVPASDPAKSYSQQETFAADTTDEAWIEAVLHRMADQLAAKVRADDKAIRTLTVKIRYNDLDESQVSESLFEPTDLETDLYPRLRPMLQRAWSRRVSLRMVSLKLSNIYPGFLHAELALASAAQQHEARQRLAVVIDELRKKRGARVILRGHDLILRDAEAKPAEPLNVSNSSTANRGEKSAPYVLRRPDPRRVNAPSTKTTSAPAAPKPLTRKAAARFQTSVPLAVHSYYSFLNSTLSIGDLVGLAKRYELPAVALTDQGNLHGAVEFMQTAKAAGIQPILGAEIRFDSQPLWLYVRNQAGYANLCRILSQPAHSAGQTTPPASGHEEPEGTCAGITGRNLKWNDLASCTEGLIAAGPDPRVAQLFPDHFYLAITHPERWRRRSGSARLPRVAIRPIHYSTPADREKYDIVQSIRTLTLLRQEHPEKQTATDWHFPGPLEMRAWCGDEPELLARSLEIAERCADFVFPFGQPQFPPYAPPDGSTPVAFLHRLVWDGARRRYGTKVDRFKPQIEKELAMIGLVGYEEYFLTVWDILRLCRRRGIEWITRGSAADSLICYCLGISDVCPIRFDLFFRRFLNQDRMQLNKLPDVDVDFAHDRKDEVIDLIFERFTNKYVAVVGGFSTYQARGAVADVAKVLGISEFQIRRFTEHFPYTSARGLDTALREHQESRDLPLEEEPYATALRLAEFLDGFPRYPKMHPCGVVLSRQPMAELTPTFTSGKGYPTTHYDMDAVETIGLVKIDILAQGGLAAMRDVKAMLRKQSLEVDLNHFQIRKCASEPASTISVPSLVSAPPPEYSSFPLFPANDADPWTDPAVWALIAGGGTRAVHHIESPAMIGLCRLCNVRNIDGLVAVVSVIRPGAANEQKKAKFARRYQGLEPTEYPHPSLESCLKDTYGLVVYEEHVLQICEAFAGLPSGRADVLRRALGKNKRAVIDEIQVEFFAAARARGHSEEKIAEVWTLVSGFAGYAFCKAHSTAYGIEAYQSAWLKRYFPVEFMAAVLTNGKGFYHPIVYVLECHRLGIPLLPPWINQPGPHFAVVTSGPGVAADSAQKFIRVPATRVKGLTAHTTENILREFQREPFGSLQDFYRRVAPLPEEMEALIRVGAFDGFGQSRTSQFWETQYVQRAYAGDPSGQGWLFPAADPQSPPWVNEPTRREQLQWEADLLDFPVSGHPLDLHQDIAWETYCPVARLGECLGQEVITCGLVIEQRIHH